MKKQFIFWLVLSLNIVNALGDSAQLLPKQILLSLDGQGSSSWDGRIYIYAGSTTLQATLFRPELLNNMTATPSHPSFGVPSFFGNTGQANNFHDGLLDFNAIQQVRQTRDSVRGASAVFSKRFPLANFETNSNFPDKNITLALAQDPAYVENPVRTIGADGVVKDTYRFLIYTIHSNSIPEPKCKEPGSSTFRLGVVKGLVEVSHPKTINAAITKAQFTNNWQNLMLASPIVLASGETIPYLCGRHPSATADGRLLVFEDGAYISYSWNSNPGSPTGWSRPQDLTNMYFLDRDKMVAGVKFKDRYPIARSPMRNAIGTSYRNSSGVPLKADGLTTDPNLNRHLYSGGYPWITPDGTDVFNASVRAWQFGTVYNDANQDNDGTIRAGESSIGLYSKHMLKHLDGAINRNRASKNLLNLVRTRLMSSSAATGLAASEVEKVVRFSALQYSRLIPTSPQPLRTMWGPYRDLNRSKMPYQSGRFIIPIFSFAGEYDEISYDDAMDGNYLIYYHMEEFLRRLDTRSNQNVYDPSITPNSAGNPSAYATLIQGAAFPLEYKTKRDETVGVSGQGIYFPEKGALATNQDGLNTLTKLITVEFFIKRLVDLRTLDPSGNPYRSIVNKPGMFDVILEKDGSIQASVNLVQSSGITRKRSGQKGGSTFQTLKRWGHYAFTYNGHNGNFQVFIDGIPQPSINVGTGTFATATGQLVIGPKNLTSLLPADEALYILDEFKISNVIRTPAEIARSAFIKTLDSAPLSEILPLGLKNQDRGQAPTYTVNQARADVGRIIFNDASLSSNGRVSCATCHKTNIAFTDGLPLTIGVAPGERNSPTVHNRSLSSLQFFDGRSLTIEQQVLMPFVDPKEMGLANRDALVTKIRASAKNYSSLFNQAALSAVSVDSAVAMALGSYLRRLYAGDSRVDRFEAGEINALSASEKRGRAIFLGKGRCVSCHSNSNYTDELFHNTGIAANEDKGRYLVTFLAQDMKAFKTPSLRDISLTAPYMHDGSILTLEEVISRYNTVVQTPSIDPEMQPLGLTSAESEDLVNFLKALDSLTIQGR